VDRHKLDDFRPYIFKTSDYGKTWTKLTTGIPDGTFVRAVREDTVKRGLLYAGTETGIYVSFDDGARWQPLQLNLPTTPIHDLVVKNDELIVATHGRSFWILDDITPLRQLTDQAAKSDFYLYQPQTAYRGQWGSRPARGPVGQNPPAGAIVNYYLKSAPKEKEEILLEFLDGQGKVVCKFSNLRRKWVVDEAQDPEEQIRAADRLPVEAGMNRFVWDLRYEPAPRIPGYSTGEYDDGLRGAIALPGTYRVRLTAGGKALEAPLEMRLDPRMNTSQADLARQFELRLKVRDLLIEVMGTVNQVRDLRAQLKALTARLAGNAAANDVLAAAAEMNKKIDKIETGLIEPRIKGTQDSLNYGIGNDGKLAVLASVIESADTAPTKGSYDLFEELSRRVSGAFALARELNTTDLAAFNALAQKAGLTALLPPTSGGPSSSTAK
jgi:hypothetical protein